MKIEIDDRMIIVDGVKISLELLRMLAHPLPDKLYRLVRRDDVTIVTQIAVKQSEVREFVNAELKQLGLHPNQELTEADVFTICWRLLNR